MKKSLLLCVTLIFLSVGFAQAGLKEIIMNAEANNGNSIPRSLPTRVNAEFDDVTNAISIQILSTKSDVAIATITDDSGAVCSVWAISTNGTDATIALPTASSSAQVYTLTINIGSEQWSGILSL